MRTKGGNLMTNNWAVVRKGGSIGSFGKGKEYHGMPIIADNLTREEAKTLAARRRKSLSPGERSYYKMGYSIVQIRKNPKGGNPMGNYQDAWTDVKGIIDYKFPFPQHFGRTDITEVIEFARLAEEHGLTNRQYDNLINKAQRYHDRLNRGGNPMAKKPRRPKQMKIMGIPVIPAVVVGGLVYWLYKNK